MKAPILRAALLLAVSSLLFSCQKEVSDLSTDNALESKAALERNKLKEFDVKGSMSTVSLMVPDYDGGWEAPNPVPAWYPGEGEGNLSHIGKFITVYNQYAYYLNDVSAQGDTYTLTDEALAKLAEYGIENVPDNIGTVFVDMRGNSIWSNGTYLYTPEADRPGRYQVYGYMNIRGGTGLYANATGHFVFNGYSDATLLEGGQPATIDEFDIKGHIAY